MANVNMTKLNKVMKEEKIGVYVLESVTRKHLYKDLLSGKASDTEVKQADDVLGCKVEDLYDTVNEEIIPSANTHQVKLKGKKPISIDVNKEYKLLGFTRKTFVEYAGISEYTFHQYITANKELEMSSDTASKIAYGLKCSLEYLFGFSEEKGKLKFYPDNKMNPYVYKIKPINELIRKIGKSPNVISKEIGLPYHIVKKLMVTGGYIPNTSLTKLCKLYKIDSEALILYKGESVYGKKSSNKTTKKSDETSMPNKSDDKQFEKESNLKPIGDITNEELLSGYKNQKYIKEMMKNSEIETAKNTSKYKHDFETKIAKLSTPVDDKISLKQLSAVIDIMSQRPELLYTFVDLCELEDDDYNQILDHIKWLIKKSK